MSKKRPRIADLPEFSADGMVVSSHANKRDLAGDSTQKTRKRGREEQEKETETKEYDKHSDFDIESALKRIKVPGEREEAKAAGVSQEKEIEKAPLPTIDPEIYKSEDVGLAGEIGAGELYEQNGIAPRFTVTGYDGKPEQSPEEMLGNLPAPSTPNNSHAKALSAQKEAPGGLVI